MSLSSCARSLRADGKWSWPARSAGSRAGVGGRAPAPGGDDGRGLGVPGDGQFLRHGQRLPRLALLLQEEGELQAALQIARVGGAAVGPHRAGEVTELFEDPAQVAPGVGLAGGDGLLVGDDRLRPPALPGQAVAQVERRHRVTQIGGPPEAPLGGALPADVGQVAAQVDQLVDVARGPQAPKASVQVLGHAAMIGAQGPIPPLPSG